MRAARYAVAQAQIVSDLSGAYFERAIFLAAKTSTRDRKNVGRRDACGSAVPRVYLPMHATEKKNSGHFYGRRGFKKKGQAFLWKEVA